MIEIPSFDLGQALATLVVTLVGSVVGADLALRKHRREQWWDRKAAAYISVLDAMHHIQRRADYLVREYGDGQQVIKENAAIEEAAQRASIELDRVTSQATFLLSREAANDLVQMEQEVFAMFPDLLPPELAEIWAKIVRRHTDRFIVSAKRDLEVEGRLELGFRTRNWLRQKIRWLKGARNLRSP